MTLDTTVVHAAQEPCAGGPERPADRADGVLRLERRPRRRTARVWGSGNATWFALEHALAEIEEAHVLVFASGMQQQPRALVNAEAVLVQ